MRKTLFELVCGDFITEDDFRNASDAGLDYVRLPFHHRYVTENGETELDRAIQWASEHGIYVILDMHAAPGCQNSDYHSDSDGTAGLWDGPEHQAEFIHLWEILAIRYKDEPAIAGYELLNEPVAPDGAMLTDLYRRTISAVREIDDRHIIFLDGNDYASDFSAFEPPLADNTVYVLHTYAGVDEAQRQARQYLDFRDRCDVPVMCNEFGEYGLTGVFGGEELHPAWWSYKMVRAGPDVPYLYMPRDNPWNLWLKEVSGTRRAYQAKLQADSLEVIDLSAVSPLLKQALSDMIAATGRLDKKEVIRLARSHPDDGPELEGVYLEVRGINIAAEADAMAQSLGSMSPGELENLAWSLGSGNWWKGTSQPW